MVATVAAVLLGCQAGTDPSPPSTGSAVTTPLDAEPDRAAPDHAEPDHAVPDHTAPDHTAPDHAAPDHAVPLGVTVDDGVVPGGVTVFDGGVPAVARLDPDLLSALRRAATAAADDGVDFWVNSGWRSPAYQEQLLRDAVAEYGSAEEAARWVATPRTSAHVSGEAVDIGPAAATAWLSRHGAGYGLCQTYRNEPWHYELRPEAAERGCPQMYADPTHDPRMRE
ncbi:M15 family metallopeptidase [Blastococcus sp. SYSU DS0617]